MKETTVFIRKIFCKYLTTCMLVCIATDIGGMGNNFFAGRYVNVEALAVIAVLTPFFFLLSTLGNMLAVGGKVVCSHAIGTNDLQGAGKAFTATCLLLVVVSLIISTALVLFMHPVLLFLKAPAHLYANAHLCATAISIGAIFFIAPQLVFGFLGLEGFTTFAKIVVAGIIVVYFLANMALVAWLDMGTVGVIIANITGLAVGMAAGFWVLLKKGRVLRPTRMSFAEFRNYTCGILRYGSFGAIDWSAALIRSILINFLFIARFTSIDLSVLGAVNSLRGFSNIIALGVSGALASFSGVFVAEKDSSSIRQLFRLAMGSGVALALFFTVVCLVFPQSIAAVFGLEQVDAVYPAITAFALRLVPLVVNYNIIYYHAATGQRILLANVLSIFSSCLYYVAFSYILAPYMGVLGAWHSLWLSEVAMTLTIAAIHLYKKRRNPALNAISLVDESGEKNNKYLAFSVENNTTAIMECVYAVKDFCRENNFGDRGRMKLELVLEELLTHVGSHAPANVPLNIRFLMRGENELLVRIRFQGKAYNPLDELLARQVPGASADEPELDEDILGVSIANRVATKVDYQYTFGINNLTVVLSF